MTGPLNEHGHMASQSGPASGQLNVSSPPKGRGFHVRFSEFYVGMNEWIQTRQRLKCHCSFLIWKIFCCSAWIWKKRRVLFWGSNGERPRSIEFRGRKRIGGSIWIRFTFLSTIFFWILGMMRVFKNGWISNHTESPHGPPWHFRSRFECGKYHNE